MSTSPTSAWMRSVQVRSGGAAETSRFQGSSCGKTAQLPTRGVQPHAAPLPPLPPEGAAPDEPPVPPAVAPETAPLPPLAAPPVALPPLEVPPLEVPPFAPAPPLPPEPEPPPGVPSLAGGSEQPANTGNRTT